MGVSNEKREELILALELDYIEMVQHFDTRAIAVRVVDRVIAEGWQWHPKPIQEPLATWEKELRDAVAKEAQVKAQTEWVRIPEFKDYEANRQGVVRNFWTKRVLGDWYWSKGPGQPIELHGKDGSPFVASLQRIMDKTFGDGQSNSWRPE